MDLNRVLLYQDVKNGFLLFKSRCSIMYLVIGINHVLQYLEREDEAINCE